MILVENVTYMYATSLRVGWRDVVGVSHMDGHWDKEQQCGTKWDIFTFP